MRTALNSTPSKASTVRSKRVSLSTPTRCLLSSSNASGGLYEKDSLHCLRPGPGSSRVTHARVRHSVSVFTSTYVDHFESRDGRRPELSAGRGPVHGDRLLHEPYFSRNATFGHLGCVLSDGGHDRRVCVQHRSGSMR